MKIKTQDLTGPALDWAVAKCEGLLCFGYCSDSERFAVEDSDGGVECFMPSTNWKDGGPIIEREGIELTMPRLITRDKWCATRIEGSSVSEEYGLTPLIAAMRCFVASQLGDEVDVPEELRS